MERTVLELQVEGFWDQFHQCHLLECIWHALTDGRRLNQLNSNLLGSPLKDCQALWCLSANYTEYTEWWWCIKVKTVHSMCQGMFLKWLALFRYNWVECSFATFGNSCTPDGAYQECMCKTDQPPCQLMRPRRTNSRVETDTYLVCISFRMTNT